VFGDVVIEGTIRVAHMPFSSRRRACFPSCETAVHTERRSTLRKSKRLNLRLSTLSPTACPMLRHSHSPRRLGTRPRGDGFEVGPRATRGGIAKASHRRAEPRSAHSRVVGRVTSERGHGAENDGGRPLALARGGGDVEPRERGRPARAVPMPGRRRDARRARREHGQPVRVRAAPRVRGRDRGSILGTCRGAPNRCRLRRRRGRSRARRRGPFAVPHDGLPRGRAPDRAAGRATHRAGLWFRDRPPGSFRRRVPAQRHVTPALAKAKLHPGGGMCAVANAAGVVQVLAFPFAFELEARGDSETRASPRGFAAHQRSVPGRVVAQVPHAHAGKSVTWLEWSADGRRLASGDDRGALCVTDITASLASFRRYGNLAVVFTRPYDPHRAPDHRRGDERVRDEERRDHAGVVRRERRRRGGERRGRRVRALRRVGDPAEARRQAARRAVRRLLPRARRADGEPRTSSATRHTPPMETPRGSSPRVRGEGCGSPRRGWTKTPRR